MLILTWPQVRAWRVERQYLSTRVSGPRRLEAAASATCGVHAQVMSAAELQFGARVDEVKPRHVQDALWKKRSLVKTWAMRGTLHLFSANEFPLYAAAMQSRDHWRKPYWLRAFGVSLGEMEAIIKGIHDVLGDGRALTRQQLSVEVAARVGGDAQQRLFADSWGALLKPAAAAGVLAFGPNVGRNVSFVRPDRWLAKWRDLDPLEAIQEVVRRFVHMHGPTRPENFIHWWGRAAAATKRLWRSMEAEFEEVHVEGDRASVLAADADAIARTKPDRGVRLLPSFDAYLMAFHPRSRLVREDARAQVFRDQGWISPVVLAAGEAVGIWESERTTDRLLVRVEPFGRLPAGARTGLREESARLGAFLGLDAELRFEPVTFLRRR